MPRREQARFVSVSQPYAGAWHSVPGDGTGATVLESKLWVAGMQRHLGLHLSASKDVLKELLEAGGGKGEDYFGDHQINGANANRRHNAALRGWLVQRRGGGLDHANRAGRQGEQGEDKAVQLV